jgi:hypothetical protein
MRDELNHANQDQAQMDDPMLQLALKDFRASVHAWTDATYHRARPAVAPAAQRIAWRRIVAWSMSLALSFSILGTAAYERHHQAVIAHQQDLQRAQERQRVLAEQHTRDTEDLLANIDSDVSREEPAALEPLAQMMTDGQ